MRMAILAIEDISHRCDARLRTDDDLHNLSQNIQECGLIAPIVVRRTGPVIDGCPQYEVLDGSHRLQACELHGAREIAAILLERVDDLCAELTMIDANLVRVELSPSDRARQTARRKAIYLVLHPETGRGGLRKSGQTATLAVRSFVAETAALSHQSERSVGRDAERGEKITPEALDRVHGSGVDTGRFLDKLKKLPQENQLPAVTRELADASSKLPGLNRLPQLVEVSANRLPQTSANGGRRCLVSPCKIAPAVGGRVFSKRSASR